ncbi:MAG: phosphoethanolamine transferase [Selenomonadaceae bacterium]|nr:phosphoethanolamine transferase [Selenomonadaceae bacterium]
MSDKKIFLAHAALFYYLGEVFYIDIGQPAAPQYFLPPIPITIALLWLIQYSTHTEIFNRRHLPNFLTGVAWLVTFPLLYTWTYQRQWFMSLIYYDFAVGTAIFIFLTGAEVLLMSTKKFSLAASLMCVLNLICWTIPLVEIIYYCMTWHCLSPASLMAVYMTNWHEAIEYLRAMLGLPVLAVIFFALGILLRFAFKAHKNFGRQLEFDRKKISAATVAVIGSLCALIYYAPQTSMANLWYTVADYAAQNQRFSENRDARLAEMKISETNHPHGTIIFVIGESASRDYMHAYNENFPFEDTPWLDSMRNEELGIRNEKLPADAKINPDYKVTADNTPNLTPADGKFIIFDNVYASWTQTVPVLQRALTEQSQYNNKEFFDSVSIVDAARKAGYKTYWFSNQGRYGEFDSAITLVAKTADVSEWTDDAFDFSELEDEILLKFFDRVDPNENNFIVFHLMGSHIYYNSRYPRRFKKWTTRDGTGMMLAAPSYANSILYTDFVLSKIFDYARANLNLQAMIYFSDHGEDLEISHNPDVFRFEMLRVPMFVYLSPEYEKIFPEKISTLESRRAEYFTNDMFYDTFCGLINAPSNKYDAGQDFSSSEYKFTRETLTTMLGQHKLTEDVKE